jgi:hypothetical protein
MLLNIIFVFIGRRIHTGEGVRLSTLVDLLVGTHLSLLLGVQYTRVRVEVEVDDVVVSYART